MKRSGAGGGASPQPGGRRNVTYLLWFALLVALLIISQSSTVPSALTNSGDPPPSPRIVAAHDASTDEPAEPGALHHGHGGTCGDGAKDCLSCLFKSTGSGECVWCASSSTCQPSSAAAECPDIEDVACPAVLHTTIPQSFRVIHVAIRKGGPEALIQLHLGLNHWGFKTTLDTRASKKQKGGPVVPFFTDMYAKEFAKAPPLRWSPNYDAWLESAVEGDVMIATETWACEPKWQAKLHAGARQMQWHLTVWPKKPRTTCTIASHTNYIAQQYMLQPRRSLLFPYISPHIIALAKTKEGKLRDKKQRLVMYDGDVKLNDDDVKPKHADWAVRKATGFTPADLYAKYGEAMVGIDLVLPGAERFVYEASLFDVCIIVDKTANGEDASDLPLPPRFRVQPNNLTALHERIQECLDRYDAVIEEQRPLKIHTQRQRDTFLRHVRRYFSNSVHIVTFVGTTEEATTHFAKFVLHALMALPFASLEIRHAPGVRFPPAERAKLLDHSYLAAVTFVEVRDGTGGAYESASVSGKRTSYALVVPVHVYLVSPELLHISGSAVTLAKRRLASGAGETAVVVGSQRDGFVVFESSQFPRVAATRCLAQSQPTSSPARCIAAAEKGARVAWTDITLRDGVNDPSLRALVEGVATAGGGNISPMTVNGAAGAQQLRAALDDLRLWHGDAGAGGTSREFLCSHPLYRDMGPEVCAEG